MGVFRRFLAWLCGKPKSIGECGEVLACKFIGKRGYSLVTRNWSFGHGEIDIIAKDKDILVFIEVRLRNRDASVRGYESISRHKKSVLRRTCIAYLKKHGSVLTHRFDVIDIEHDYATNTDTIHHYENVPLF
ncbi:MAG: YraN family protein [Puniceicoccales bacterium]|jgi:putative endonuclease|nr:YraN family protein [Puniceicoccales bacterium]